MIGYLIALARYEVLYGYLVLTGRKYQDSPQYFLDAYNDQARSWNQRQNRKAVGK